MACATKRLVRFTNAPLPKKVKMGAKTVVSAALVKKGATNLVPKLHVKAGDLVMVMAGSEKFGRGKTAKVIAAYPRDGKILVEGINMITKAVKPNMTGTKTGLVQREAPFFASKVMLFCTSCKKPTRAGHKELENGKKTRTCKRCGEGFDG